MADHEQTSTRSDSDPTALNPSTATYLTVSTCLLAFCVALWFVTRLTHDEVQRARLVAPMAVLVALTALVWLAMLLSRNVSLMLGRISAKYYVDYVSNTPQEHIERPARTFNNLMQVPTLFYVACTLCVVLDQVDRVQLVLAWIFVATRALHALVYIGWNSLPPRFGIWVAGCITLGVIWYRLTAGVLL